MPLCKYYVLGKASSPPPRRAVPLGPSPKLRSPPVGGLLPPKPKLPLSLFRIAYHFFLLFLSPFQAGRKILPTHDKGKTRPYDRRAVALTRFLGTDCFQESIPRSAPFLRAHLFLGDRSEERGALGQSLLETVCS
jgi:hypothetical protein